MQDDENSSLEVRRGSRPAPSRDAAPWLFEYRVEIPQRIAGYVDRPALEARCAPLSRQVTVLQAPGGFGKTALLAQCCQRLRDSGVPVAWLELDDHDGPNAVATYLTLAFERAGVDSNDIVANKPSGTADQVVESDTQADFRIDRLLRAIKRLGQPCVLALDELERLRNAEAIAILNAVLTRAPHSLRFALAFRERPPGLDIAMHLLEGRGESITVEDLRFSKSDTARFFDETLSRRELASVVDNSAGWAIAIRIYRNMLRKGAPMEQTVGHSDLAAAWIDSRLWRDLSEDDREFLLDISLFDRIDTELIDEATGWQQSQRRIASMGSLSGLVQKTGGSDPSLQLHPLLREHCANRRFFEDPARFRSIQAGIARGLARRGQVVGALQHATEAGDTSLVGEIASNAGGIKVWIGRGYDALQAMDGWLSAKVLSHFPRLALMRCVVLAMSGKLKEARQVYQAAAIESAGFTRVPGGGKDTAMELDHLLALGMLLVLGCPPLSRYESLISAAKEMAMRADLEPLYRGIIRHGLSLALTETTEFDQAVKWAERAREDLGHQTLYLSPHLDYQLGLAAMAQGRASEAANRYEGALKLARAGHLGNADTVMVSEILAAELALERGAGPASWYAPAFSLRLLEKAGAWFDVYAANIDLAADRAWQDSGIDQTLSVLEAAQEFARATERAALVNFLSAFRVSLLLNSGRVADAHRAWQRDDLPEDDGPCLDFKAYRWREVEAIAGARLSLLIGREEFDEARRFASHLRAAVAERGLARTLMRALALSMRLEFRAGNSEQALGHLVEYISMFSRSDYLRPLAQVRDIALPLLRRLVDEHSGETVATSAAELELALVAVDDVSDEGPTPALTSREFEVLQRIEYQSDQDIARELDLTYHRVRYAVRGLFAKLDVQGRHEAADRARALGILRRGSAESPPVR